jgi:aconitase B
MADLQETLKQLKSEDMNDRYKAWDAAGPLGASAVKPLVAVSKMDNRTFGKAGKLALQNVVNYAGRPGAEDEAKAIAKELMQVAADPSNPRMIRADALYFIGTIGGSAEIPGLAKLLQDRVIREEARQALERIPGDESLAALKTAATTGATDFHRNIQQSLYNRALTNETIGIKADGTAVSRL